MENPDELVNKGSAMTNTFLLSTIRQKDEKIIRLKQKVAKLRQELARMPSNDQTDSTLLHSINQQTNNSFMTNEQCISFITDLLANRKEQKNIIKESVKDDSNSSDSYDSYKKHFLVKEMGLMDKIYDLEIKLESSEKLFNRKLKIKDDEYADLQDELTSLQARRLKDEKLKNRVKQLEADIEDLQSELDSKINESSSKDAKIKELNQNRSLIDQLNQQLTDAEENKRQLQAEIDRLNTIGVNDVREKDKLLEKRQEAIDKMRLKITALTSDKVDLATNFDLVTTQLDECRANLGAEKQRVNELEKVIGGQKEQIQQLEKNINNSGQKEHIQQLEKKINNLEEELRRCRQNPPMEDNLKKTAPVKPATLPKPNMERKAVPEAANNRQQVVGCPNCQLMINSTEIDDHLLNCLDESG